MSIDESVAILSMLVSYTLIQRVILGRRKCQRSLANAHCRIALGPAYPCMRQQWWMRHLHLSLAVIGVCAWATQACHGSAPTPSKESAPEVAATRIIPAHHAPREGAAWAVPQCAESPYRLCTQSDFREADFRDNELSGHVVFFNANLEDAKLDGANLSNSALHFAFLTRGSLKNTDLSGSDLVGATLRESLLERAQLRNINCLGCDFRFANLQDSDLNGAQLKGANFSYADLRGANLQNTDLSQTHWHHTVCPDGTLSFDTCGGHLTPQQASCVPSPHANCADQDLSRLDWRRTNLTKANLEAADLRATLLNGADLTQTNLAYANLRETNFKDADLLGANLARADLAKSYWENTRCPDGTISSENGHTCGGHIELTQPDCHIRPGADCRNADLAGLDLSYANLAGADLRGANLVGSRLEGANLQGAALQNAQLEGADLSHSRLRNAITESANLTDIITKSTECNSSLLRFKALDCIR